MNLINWFWHVSDFLALPLALGLISSMAAKVLWRGELNDVSWLRVSSNAAAASVLASVVGLVSTGSDGHMISYALMVVACAASIGWCARRSA